MQLACHNMSVMDNEGRDPQGPGNTPRRTDAQDHRDLIGRAATLAQENARLLALLKVAASWMIPFDAMDEGHRFEFDRAKAEVEAEIVPR